MLWYATETNGPDNKLIHNESMAPLTQQHSTPTTTGSLLRNRSVQPKITKFLNPTSNINKTSFSSGRSPLLSEVQADSPTTLFQLTKRRTRTTKPPPLLRKHKQIFQMQNMIPISLHAIFSAESFATSARTKQPTVTTTLKQQTIACYMIRPPIKLQTNIAHTIKLAPQKHQPERKPQQLAPLRLQTSHKLPTNEPYRPP